MQPVRRLEEQAAIRGDRPCAAQQVLERRRLGAFRVGALRDLRQLVGVAEQDERARGPGHGAHGRERQLAGLVDEQDVDRVGHVVAGPEPAGAADDLELAARQPGRDLLVRRDPLDVLVRAMHPPLRPRAGRSGRRLPPRGRRRPRHRGSWRSRDATGRRRRLACPARRARAPCGRRCRSCPCRAAPGSAARCRRARRRAGGRRRAASRRGGRAARPRAGASHAAGGAGPGRGPHDTARVRSARDR